MMYAAKAVTVLHQIFAFTCQSGCLGQLHVTADVLDSGNVNHLSLHIPSGLFTFCHVELGMASWLGCRGCYIKM